MKFSSILNLVLIAVTFAGVYQCYRLRCERQRLQEEYASLSSRFGEFSEGQNSVPQIVRLETDDPMVFQWRVYLPAGYTGVVQNHNDFRRPSLFSRRGINLGHRMPWSYPAEFLITQKFEFRFEFSRPIVNSHIQCTNWVTNQSEPVNYTSGGGRGRSMRPSQFLVDYWSEIEFEADDAFGQSIEVDDGIRLLRVKIPEQLMEEYLAASGGRGEEGVLTNLYLSIEKVE